MIEGLFSFVCAILIWFGLPNNPENAYFLNDEEKWMMRIRNEQRRKYMGSEKFSWAEMRIAVTDPKFYFSSATQFCQDILLYGFSTFLPSILKSLGYNSFMSNALTVPVYIWAAIVFIAVAVCADRFSRFAWVRPLSCWVGRANKRSLSLLSTSSVSLDMSSCWLSPTTPSNISPRFSAASPPTQAWD